MFEKYLLDRRLRHIMMATIEIGKINQYLIKQKLSLYKKLLRNPDQELIEQTLSTIQEQDDSLRTIKKLMIDLEYKRGLKLTPHIKIALSLISRGESLLNDFLHTFYSQRCALTDKHADMDVKIRNYRTYFKRELAAYEKYEKLAKKLPPELMREVKNEAIEFLHTYDLQDYVKVTTLTLVLYGIMGFVKPEIIRENFKDAEHTILTLGIIVATCYFYNRLSKWLRKIKNK